MAQLWTEVNKPKKDEAQTEAERLGLKFEVMDILVGGKAYAVLVTGERKAIEEWVRWYGQDAQEDADVIERIVD